MAELPEVEAARWLLMSHCLNGTIVDVETSNDNMVFDGVLPSVFKEAMELKKILSVHRKGKHLWLQLNCPRWPTFEIGSGRILVKGFRWPQCRRSESSAAEEFRSPHGKVWLKLDTGVEVAFIDKSCSGRIRLLADPERAAPIKGLGPDAFLALPDPQDLIRSVKTTRGSIKALLLDQSFIAGIGNWVGDEVLYQAKIHPEQPANSLTEEEVTRLHTAIREVLHKAVTVVADGNQYPRTWLFHHRWGKKLGMIDGNQIESITISGRTSAFVPNVQKYSGPELKGAKTKAAVEEDLPHEGEGMAEFHFEPNVFDAPGVAVDMPELPLWPHINDAPGVAVDMPELHLWPHINDAPGVAVDMPEPYLWPHINDATVDMDVDVAEEAGTSKNRKRPRIYDPDLW